MLNKCGFMNNLLHPCICHFTQTVANEVMARPSPGCVLFMASLLLCDTVSLIPLDHVGLLQGLLAPLGPSNLVADPGHLVVSIMRTEPYRGYMGWSADVTQISQTIKM